MPQNPNYIQSLGGGQPGPFTELLYQQLQMPMDQAERRPVDPNAGWASGWGNAARLTNAALQGIKRERFETLVKEKAAREEGLQAYQNYVQMAVLSNPNLTEDAKAAAMQDAAQAMFGHVNEELKDAPKEGFGARVKDVLTQMVGGKLPKVEPFNPYEAIGRMQATVSGNPEFQRQYWIDQANQNLATAKEALAKQYGGEVYPPALLNARLAPTLSVLAEKLGPEYAQRFQTLALAGVVSPEQALANEKSQMLLNYLKGMSGEAVPPATREELPDTWETEYQPTAQPKQLGEPLGHVPPGTAYTPTVRGDQGSGFIPQRLLQVGPASGFVETGPPGPRPETGVGSVYAPSAAPSSAGRTPALQPGAGMPYILESMLSKEGWMPPRETKLVAINEATGERHEVDQIGGVLVKAGTTVPLPNQDSWAVYNRGVASSGTAGMNIVPGGELGGDPNQYYVIDKAARKAYPVSTVGGKPLIAPEPTDLVETPEGLRFKPRSQATAQGLTPGRLPTPTDPIEKEASEIYNWALEQAGGNPILAARIASDAKGASAIALKKAKDYLQADTNGLTGFSKWKLESEANKVRPLGGGAPAARPTAAAPKTTISSEVKSFRK